MHHAAGQDAAKYGTSNPVVQKLLANWLGKLKSTLQVIGILWTLLNNPIFSRWNFAFDFGVLCTAAVFTIWSAVDYILANRNAVRWD